MDKRGAKKLMIFYWFLLFGIVAGGVVYQVAVFYGAPYNFRKIESEILLKKTIDCLLEKNYLREEVFDATKFNNKNLLEQCKFTFQVEDEYDNSERAQYYIKIDIFNFDPLKSPPREEWEKSRIINLEIGNSNLNTVMTKENEISSKEFYSLRESGESYIIKILAIVGKFEKNGL